METLPLRVGAGKFFYEEGSIHHLSAEIRRLGASALMIGGPKSMEVVRTYLPKKWNKGLQIIEIVYTEECSINSANRLAALALKTRCTVIVGIGGGKCLDLAKAAATLAELNVITVPTCLATCAASSAICVMYHDDGSADHSISMLKEVDVVIADPRILATAPRRLLAAGVMDSMAKLVESLHQASISDYKSCALNHYIGYRNAIVIDEVLRAEGVSAYNNSGDPQKQKTIALINLLLTSVVSGFCFGTTQMALAHGFYDGVRKYCTKEAAQYLHGEIVAIGILIQMAYNGSSEDEIFMIISMMKEMEMPITLKEIGLSLQSPHTQALQEYMFKTCNIDERHDQEKIRRFFT